MSAATTNLDDLYAAYAEDRDGHAKARSIILSSMAIISVLSSSLLMRMILRSSTGLTTTYHRLLVGMATGDILLSMSFMSFGAALPTDVGYMEWNARGNQTTCNAMGFLMSVGLISTILYSCWLNLYSLAIVKYNATEYYIRHRMEPVFHVASFVIAVGKSVASLVTQGYNSCLTSACNVPIYDPPHCEGVEDNQIVDGFVIPCGRGRGGPGPAIHHATYLLLLFGAPIVVVSTLAKMFRHISQQERKMATYGARALNHGTEDDTDNTDTSGGTGLRGVASSMASFVKRSFEGFMSGPSPNRQDSNSRPVMNRALSYSIAYILTFTWLIIYTILEVAGLPIPLSLKYLISIFTPLQGFWNLIIFAQPMVVRAKRSQGKDLSWCRAIAVTFGFVVKAKTNASSNTKTVEIREEEEEKEKEEKQIEDVRRRSHTGPACQAACQGAVV